MPMRGFNHRRKVKAACQVEVFYYMLPLIIGALESEVFDFANIVAPLLR